MEFLNCNGQFSNTINRPEVTYDVFFKNNGSILVSQKERIGLLEQLNALEEEELEVNSRFENLTCLCNGRQIEINSLEQTSIACNNNIQVKEFIANNGKIIYANHSPSKVIYEITNYINPLPNDFTLTINDIRLKIYHNNEYCNNSEQIRDCIKNEGMIYVTSQIEILGNSFLSLDFERQNIFCDDLLYFLSFLFGSYHKWIYRKDFIEEIEISHYQRLTENITYFINDMSYIDNNNSNNLLARRELIENLLAIFLNLTIDKRKRLVIAIDFLLHSISSDNASRKFLELFTCIECLEDYCRENGNYPPSPLVDRRLYSRMMNFFFEKDDNGTYINNEVNAIFSQFPEHENTLIGRIKQQNYLSPNRLPQRRKFIELRDMIGPNASELLSDNDVDVLLMSRNALIHTGNVDETNFEEIFRLYYKAVKLVYNIILFFINSAE